MSGRADVRRLERSRLPAVPESVAAAAEVVAPPRSGWGGFQGPAHVDGVRPCGPADVRDGRGRHSRAGRRDRARARRCKLAAIGIEGGLGGHPQRRRHPHCAAQAGELRVLRCLVGALPVALSGYAAEEYRAVLSGTIHARGSHGHVRRPGGGRRLCAFAAVARRDRGTRRGAPAHDLVPDVPQDALAATLGRARGRQSLATFLRKSARLSPVGIALLHEATRVTGRSPGTMSPSLLAALIKNLPLRLDGVSPIGNAISTAGGIALDELDENFMLRQCPGVFAAGEMLDWEAPTGGYLLQACFSTGAAAGRGALAWLRPFA